MSHKTNKSGGKKVKNYGGSAGMSKHRKSGVAHNHANSISRVREYNKELERLAELKKRQKGKLYSSVLEVFKEK